MKYEEQQAITKNAMDQAFEAWQQVKEAQKALDQPDRVFFRSKDPEWVQRANQAAQLADWWAEGVRQHCLTLRKVGSVFASLVDSTYSSAKYASRKANRLRREAEDRWLEGLT